MYDRPFRWWVQSVMPLVFDDSLSYYEVLAKLTKYIEGLTGDVEQIEKILATIEGIEDVTQFTEMLENIQNEIGNLSDLSTQTKANLVSAINEIALKADIAYWKPPTGIPESDLSQSVQDKLNRTGEATEYIINNKTLKKAPNNNSPADLGLGTYSVPSGGIPWDTLSQDVRDRIDAGGSATGGTKDYTELINKPQINGHTLNAGDNTLENLGIGTYSKPNTGIPESDLSAEVQEKLNTSGGIADNQNTFIASRDYEPGELVYINGTLYRIKYKILAGTNMIPGNNIEVTDISSELEKINSDIDALQSGAGPDSWNLTTNVQSFSYLEKVDFFEYFNCIGGESYSFIVEPVDPSTAMPYILEIRKRDGTVVLTQTVTNATEYMNRKRFTFIPNDSGEYYCTFYRNASGYTSDLSAVKVTIEYTQSQGITELWTKVNEAIEASEDIPAIQVLVAEHQTQLEGLDGIPERVDNIEDTLDTLKSSFMNDTEAITGNKPIVFIKGHYLASSIPSAGLEVSYYQNDNFVCAIAPCEPGDIFTAHIWGYTGRERAYFFCDENMLLVENGWAETHFVLNGEVEAPANSRYVIFNNRLETLPDGYYAVKGKLLIDVIDEIKSSQVDITSATPASPLLFYVGGIKGVDGTADSTTNRLRTFNFFPKDIKKIKANNNYLFSVFVWDSNRQYIGRITTDDSISTSGNIKTFTEFYPERWLINHPNTLLRITVRREDNGRITLDEAINLIFETENESVLTLPDVPVPTECETIYEWYDEFVTDGFATKELLTTVNNLPMYAYDFSALTKYAIGDDDHVDNTGTEYERRKKILLFSGMHGNEKGGVIGLYKFIYNLCNNPDYKKYLGIFNFKVVPVCNPTGYNNNTRNNYNGVNINRFDQAANEPECIALKALIDGGNYELFVDCHCSDSSKNAETINEPIGVMSFAVGTDEDSLVKYHNLYRTVYSDFENDVRDIFSQDFPNNRQLLFPWIGTNNQTARNYGYTHEVALPYTVEPRKFIKYTDGTTGLSSTGELIDGTDFINIANFDKIKYKRINTTSTTATNGIAFYKEDGSFISGVPSVLGADNYGYTWYEVDVPIGAKTVRFSLFQNTTTYGEFECYAYAGSDISGCLETSNFCYGISGSTVRQNGSSSVCAIRQTKHVLETFIDYVINK